MKFAKLKKKLGLILITSAIVLTSFGFFAFDDDNNFKIVQNLDIYYSLFRELNLFYVDETDPEKLVKTSIDAMLRSLDPYTTYFPESELERFNFMTTGKYGGIGALIRKSGEYAVIVESYENFPAYKAGLKPGDIIIEINEKSTRGENLTDISNQLKGIPNTSLNIVVNRPGLTKPMKKTLVREIIKIKSVPYYGMLNEKIGYINLINFTKDAYKEVKNALVDLKKNNKAKSIILDLRTNPGGLLLESVHIVNLFVEKEQEIVSTKGKVKHFDNTYKTRFSPIDMEIPLIILVSRMSASASEIVAGSMQDLDRAVIIGQRTFGKGLVQTTRPLSFNAQLKVTAAKYYIPSGRCIQALDYTHRNDDGSVGQIPDSLISEFLTKNRRKVYDGGGIMPDIVIKPEGLSKITTSLYTKNLIFDYTTQYGIIHDSIPPISDFSFTDDDYQNFINFLEGKDFDYQTKSEDHLNKLIETAKKEKYYDNASDEFASLQLKLAHDKSKDLRVFKEEIKQLIAKEIVGRYYFQNEKIQISLVNDIQINKAIELLSDLDNYYSILNGIEKIDLNNFPD